MKLDKEKIDRLREILSPAAQNIVIVSHTNPDGDAIGSSLAWKALLETMGHHVTCIVPNKYPYFLDWMSNISTLRIFKDDHNGECTRLIEKADLIFCLDFNQIARLEGMSDAIANNTRAKRILIDHHLDPPHVYDLEFSHPESSSTAFLIYSIIKELAGEEAITPQMGEAIYVGLMTDTGNFSFSYLTPELFRAVAVLVEKGIDIPQINSAVYNSFTEDRVRLLGYAINKMQTLRTNNVGVAYIGLKENELRRFHFQVGDSEGFVNYPLTIRDIQMSAMFLETKHFIRVSLRSRGDIDVNVFARRYFEGGGHKNAAGGKSYLDMAKTIDHFRKAVEEYFAQ